MSTNKKLRTPIIKPRTQGGTFFTFGSAMEDIGLNINELSNKVELSHYVLLNIPKFDETGKFVTRSVTAFDASKNIGDYKFAEGFQNYVLNMETVVRNQSDYNFASSKTVSERVFWKWLKSGMNFTEYTPEQAMSTKYYIDSSSVVKCFGRISAGAQRTDDYGIYNETFVQIPSSYGKTKIFFKAETDENYRNNSYNSTNEHGYIENISEEEIDATTRIIKATGLSCDGVFDVSTASNRSYVVSDVTDRMSVEFDLNNLRKIYNDDTLTFDDIAMNNVPEGLGELSENFEFNAVLVYYSIYNSTKKSILATNAYGILLLDNAVSSGESPSILYNFPSLLKTKSTSTSTGTSFSFRINVKTTSAYSGDTHIVDNSVPSFEMAEDFNDAIRNLSSAVNVLKSNASYLAKICQDNESIKYLAANALDKVDDIEKTVNSIKYGEYFNDATIDNIYCKENTYSNQISLADSKSILDCISITSDDDGKVGVKLNKSLLTGNAEKIANTMIKSSDLSTYESVNGLLAILVNYIKNIN